MLAARCSLALLGAALALAAGCSLDRRALSGGSTLDAGSADGSADASSVLDATDADLDAPSTDAGSDAPGSDVGRDAFVCPTSGPEACDLDDDDCDGLVDEGACGGCETFVLAGHVYLSCPPVTGWAAWEGACRRVAPGYELAHLDDAVENAAVAARLSGGDHFVGVNDFESNGAYVGWDRMPAPFVGTFSDAMAPRASEPLVVLQPDGRWDDDPPDASFRLLCEGLVGVRPCVPGGAETRCDGIDEDCDGAPDDGLDCGRRCATRTFWDHVYWICDDTGDFDAEKAFCDAGGAAPPIVRDTFENAWLGAQASSDAWLGLTQTLGASEPAGSWSWGDGGPLAWNQWGSGEPNDCCHGYGNEEQCAILDDPGGGWYDGTCDVAFALTCERGWAWP